MYLVRVWILILTLAVFGFITVAQDDANNDQALFINYVIDHPTLCTREQAISFFELLDEFEQHLNDLALVRDMYTLGSWLDEHNAWVNEYWSQFNDDACDGTGYQLRALQSWARYMMLEQMFDVLTGFSIDDLLVNPPRDKWVAARALADGDLAAMERSEDPNIQLELNRVPSDFARCGTEQTLEFYATIDGFEKNADQLLELDSWESLKSWAFNFHLWRKEAWGTFFERPCGSTLALINYVDSKIYLAGMTQVAGGDPSDLLAKTIENWRIVAVEDLAVVEAMTSE